LIEIDGSGHTLSRGPRPRTSDDFASIKAETIINLEKGWFEFLHGRSYQEDIWCEKRGKSIFHLPLSTFHAPTEFEVSEFLRGVRLAMVNGSVYFHCEHGVDRTGFMAAAYRIRCMGWAKAAAVREMLDCGFNMFLYASWIGKL